MIQRLHPYHATHIMRYIILILYISTCQLSAESLEKAEELEPITVTATRFNELVNDVPHDVHLIDEIDILEDMPRSLPETFRSNPGVLVQKTANGKGSPFIQFLSKGTPTRGDLNSLLPE